MHDVDERDKLMVYLSVPLLRRFNLCDVADMPVSPDTVLHQQIGGQGERSGRGNAAAKS